MRKKRSFLLFFDETVVGTILDIEVLAERHDAIRVNQVLMKANTTKNTTSVVMIAIVILLMTQTILVGVQTAEINENGVLLLLLTLTSAVLSGINGFGRRTTKAFSLLAIRRSVSESANVRWSARSNSDA